VTTLLVNILRSVTLAYTLLCLSVLCVSSRTQIFTGHLWDNPSDLTHLRWMSERPVLSSRVVFSDLEIKKQNTIFPWPYVCLDDWPVTFVLCCRGADEGRRSSTGGWQPGRLEQGHPCHVCQRRRRPSCLRRGTSTGLKNIRFKLSSGLLENSLAKVFVKPLARKAWGRCQTVSMRVIYYALAAYQVFNWGLRSGTSTPLSQWCILHIPLFPQNL